MANNEYDQFLEEDFGSYPQSQDGNEYDQLVDDQGIAQRRKAQLNVRSAQEADPKKTLQALKLSREYNVPPSFAEKNFDVLNKRRQTTDINYDKIIDESPALAEWLQQPENARLAKNDLPKLGGIEQRTRRFRAEKTNPVTIHKEYLRAGKGGLRQLETSTYLVAAAYGKADVRSAAEAIAGGAAAQQRLRDEAPGYVKEFDKILAEEGGDVNNAFKKLTDGYSDIKKRNILDGLKKFGIGGIQTVGESLDLVYESIVNNPRAVGYMTIESLANSFPSLVGGVAGGAGGGAVGSVVPGVGTAAGGVAGFVGGTFVGSSFVEIGASIQEELSERGIDLADADAVEIALKNPELMAEVKDRAERKGLTTAAVDAAFSLFAGQAVAKSGKGFFKTARAAGRDIGVQATGEAVSEAAGQLAREEGDITKVDIGQAVAEGVISLGHSAGETIIGGASRIARDRLSKKTEVAAEQATNDAAKALKTMKDLEALEKTLFDARELQDVKDAPNKIQELIDLTTGGDEGQSIFFQADDFKNYWDRKGKSPIEEAERLLKGGAKALQESATTGTPVETTAGKFVSEMANTPENDDILGIARTSPDGGTLQESQQVMNDLPAVMEQLADEALQEIDTSEEFERQAKEIGKEVRQQLRAAGQVGLQSETNAALSEAVFSTLAKRTGIPARELFDKYGLTIRGPEQIGEVTEGQQVLNQDRISKLTPAENTFFESVFANEADRQDLLEQVPSARFESGQFIVDDQDFKKLDQYVSDVVRLRQRGDKLPPSFFSLEFPVSATDEKILEQGGGRGRIRFGKDRKFNIDLLKGADPSTFPHELAHFFLEVMGDLAETDGVPQDIKDDYQAVLDWFGVKSRADIGVDQHEQWARGFEAYLMEGKSPSIKLRKMFARFRQWLTAVYRNIRNLEVELSPEIRDVFNRMLATEQEIAEANSTGDFDPMFSDPTAFGMTGKKAERYMKAVEDAQFAAEDQLLAKAMDGFTRKRTKAYKEARKKVKEQVTEEIDSSNLYKALAMLQRGTRPDGSAIDQNAVAFKLDRKALVDEYGADFVKNNLPRPFVYSREDGVHHDVAAQLLGFQSGDDLVTQIANATPRKEAIEVRTDIVMGEQFKDLIADDTELEAEALKSIHNDKRAQLLRLELEHIIQNDLPTFKEFTRRTIKFPPPDRLVKAEAQRIIGSRKVGQIRPNVFLAAQRRARQEAAKAWSQGDRDAVYSAKMRELLNHYMYSESVKFQEKLRKDQAKFKKIFGSDKDLAKNRDINFVKASRAVLAAFGLGRSTTTPAEHLEDMRRYDPEGFETVKVLVDNATQKANPFKEISMNDYGDMSEAVFALWDLSKRSKELEIDGNKVDIDQAKDEILSQLDQSTKKKIRLKYDEDADKWDKTKSGLLGTKALLRRMEHWVSAMDLGDINGSFRKYLWTPVSEASDRYTLVSTQIKKNIAVEAEKIKKRMTQDPIIAPEINFKFQNKAQLMGALLHIGNTSNKAKLLVGRGWGNINEDGSLNTKRWDAFLNRMFEEGVIGKPEMDFIQFTWDQFESLKPMAQKAHKQLNGYFFNEITSEEFETPFGKYRGGYAPAQIDPTPPKQGAARAYGVADKQKIEELSQMATSSYTWPAAGGNGFTKSRITNFNKPLLLDINLINRHIDQVARFAIIKPAVVDASKVILQPDIRAAITDIDPTVINEMIIPSLSRADKQRIQTLEGQGPAFVAKWANYFRTTASMQLMFLSVQNTAEQLTGFFPGLLRVNAKQLTTAAAQFIKAPRQTADLIAEKSQAMKVRMDTNLFEYTRRMKDVFDDPDGLERMRDWANKHMYVSQTYLQNFMDIVVWQGSYNQAVEAGLAETEAIRTADRDVRETQSSIRAFDISRAEANPLLRVFQMFMGFFNNLANLNVSEFRNVYYGDLGLKEKFGRGFYVYLMGFAMLAIGSELVRKGLSGGDLDEDDDGDYIDDAAEILVGSQVRLLTGMVPVVGPAVQAGINKGNDKYFDDRVSASPAITAISGVVGTPVQITKKAIDGKQIKTRDIKDAMTATGVMLGLPIGPAGKPVGYLLDVERGEARPSGPIDFARGLVTGKAGDR